MSDEQRPEASSQSVSGLTDVDLKHHSQELGLLGYIFGSRDSAPTNAAGIAVVLSLVLLAIVTFGPLAPGLDRADMVKTMTTVLLTSLAYLFGAASRQKS